jgi:hypothetical protein
MKRIVLLLMTASVIYLTGCETTKEITLRPDGTGILTTTSDMSSLIGIAKMAGEANELNKLKDEKAVDTTVSMEKMADELPDLTAEEKEYVKKGTLGINMDLKNEKFLTQMTFPFNQPKDIATIDKMYSRIIVQVMKKQLDSSKAEMPEGIPKEGMMPDGSIDDYYNFNIGKGIVERKLLADKYAGVASDEKMKAMKEMSSMGVGNSKMILNLPSPVKKAEGKNVTVSEDKKKVTIMSTTEDFFADGKSLEFRIEY